MDRATLQLLASYNQHANEEMFKSLVQLSDAQWKQELGGFYKSIKGLCSHIYLADFNWLKRFGVVREFDYLNDPLFDQTIEWYTGSEIFSSIADYQTKRQYMDVFFHKLTAEITDAELPQRIKYKNWKGEEQNRLLGGMILHLFNHQTHHRGMISLYLENLGIENDFSSLVVWT